MKRNTPCANRRIVRGVYFALRRRGLIACQKTVWNLDERNFLVSARKGKNKGRYIKLEHKTGETP